jgi:flagellar motor switch protein FliN/FliY
VTAEPMSSSPEPTEPEPAAPEPAEAAVGSPAHALGMDALLDVSMPVVVEIGRTDMTLNEVAALRTGSIFSLDRLVGESVDVLVGERKLAEGEVVVVGDHLGIRIVRVNAGPAVGGTL